MVGRQKQQKETSSGVHSRDQLPSQKDYKQIRIATVESSSDIDSAHLAGNILDSNESTTWRTQSRGHEFLTINLPNTEDVRRVIIEWDLELTRGGPVQIGISYFTGEDKTPHSQGFDIDREGFLFTVLDLPQQTPVDRINIFFPETGIFGISTVAIYGYDIMRPTAKAKAETPNR